MILDLNGFKLVNDRHGHAAGDSLLKQFSHELLSHTRTSDVVGRWGGDEFIVVLEGNMTGVNAQIDRIRKWVFGKYALQLGAGNDELKIDLSASIGTARWEPGQTTQQLVEVADAAMYREKHLTYAARV
jgi:diguanylate cyclase (GGDEF)-like protein